MDHQNLEKMTSTAPMLPRDEEKVVMMTTGSGGVGKVLIREDTILANIQGCAGCGRTPFACAGVEKQWSALCWGKQSDKKYYCLLIFLSTTFALSLIGTSFFCFTNIINNAVQSSMALRNNSIAFEMWRTPTVTPVMKVHIFNYTNWERVRDGYEEKLHVEDVGPFVYSQTIERVNIEFNEKDQLTYQEKNTFKYLPEKTKGAQYDQIYVPNLPLLTVYSLAIEKNLNNLMQFSLNSALQFINHPHAFIKLPVHSFLWGYEDTIISTAKPILSLQGQLNFDRFGLLATKNGTGNDRFTINTGAFEKDRINIIEKFNSEDHLSHWGSAECNSVEASDGSMFPPALLDRKHTLRVFFPNLCRRLPFQYEKDVMTEDGIQLYRYRMPGDVFDTPDTNPYNQCYCEIESATCPPKGVINVTACAMGAPALASFPHFYRGNETLRQTITGLHPDPKEHDSFLDLHPTLGIALAGKSALQINIQVKKTSSFTPARYLQQGLILPVAWLDMSVEELPENVKSLVYHGTYSTAAAQLGLTAMCLITLTVSGVCLFIMFVRRRQKPCATLKKLSSTELKNQSLS